MKIGIDGREILSAFEIETDRLVSATIYFNAHKPVMIKTRSFFVEVER